MTRSALAAVAALALGAGLIAGCTSGGPTKRTDRPRPAGATSEKFQLTAFRDCPEALQGLRAAARANLTAWGYRPNQPIDGPGRGAGGVEDAAPVGAAPGAGAPGAADKNYAAPPDSGSGGNHSGTNTHEAGVDEPDLVKTDGKRIITVHSGKVHVVDAASRTLVATLDLQPTTKIPYQAANLLLSGDRLLVIGAGGYHVRSGERSPQVVLIDLSGTPRVTGTFAIEGSVVDARQVGATVRVVIRSAPAIQAPTFRGSPDAYATAMLEKINSAPIEDWLPAWTATTPLGSASGRVDCSAVARPVDYTAHNLLTVLTFDLGRGELGNGDPVTVAADGDTVYSNGPALYVANDQQWRVPFAPDGRGLPQDPRTEIYKFDTSKPGRPTFVAGGAVDGWLLNQYSMSDWNGHLRVATTAKDASTVYALRQVGRDLVPVGQVGGLGKGERIYAVRFIGPTGYVVTFRQTDPLYTVDLRDPSQPRVTGELKITGYSAYLHPAGDGRLLGIGQEATTAGRVQGTQVSLFDVSNAAAPTRLAQFMVKYSRSQAEFDPHAFLYWPKTGLLVVPLGKFAGTDGGVRVGALALRVGDGSITELGFIEHPNQAMITRSLIIDETLWTVSPGGLLASDLRTTTQQAWLPFGR